MNLLTWDDYYEYIKTHKTVRIEDIEVPIGEKHSIKRYQPEDFELETTSVWSFPKRGDWATHKSEYRGNWAPQVVRNLILRYSRPGELVLDQMCGGGTTLIEAKLLERRAIGVDINYEALMLTFDRLNFSTPYDSQDPHLYHGDAKSLSLLENNSIDLVATHPPYFNIIPYSKRIQGD
ncbi:MAG: TRM11 family SAM-dependent methyltransferase, partial [Aquificaceae bacterium]